MDTAQRQRLLQIYRFEGNLETYGRKKAYYPCFATHDTMEIQMNRSRDYVSDAKKKALELGWVQVLHRAGTSDLVWPRIGVEDEEVKRKKKRESWGRSELKPVG